MWDDFSFVDDTTDYYDVGSLATTFDSYDASGLSDPLVGDYGGLLSDYYGAFNNYWDVPLNTGIDWGSVDSGTATDGTAQQLFPDGGSVMYGLHGEIYQTMPDGTQINYSATGTPLITTPGGTTYNSVTDYQLDTGKSVAPPSGSSLTGIIASISAVSQAALGIVNAWKNVGQPAPRVAQVTTQASGAVSTPTKQGTIVTRLPNGQTTVARMPVGTPYVFSDGSTVVNNGDGTLTTISATGTTSKSSIGTTQSASTGKSNIGILAAVGLGMMLLSEGS